MLAGFHLAADEPALLERAGDDLMVASLAQAKKQRHGRPYVFLHIVGSAAASFDGHGGQNDRAELLLDRTIVVQTTTHGASRCEAEQLSGDARKEKRREHDDTR